MVEIEEGTRPEYVYAKVPWPCENTFETRAVKSELHVENYSNCHPFYTGNLTRLDKGGRVEQFNCRHAKE